VAAEKERILIVDDEESIRELVSKIVTHIGYEAIVARNGQEALGILRNKPISIMITDMKMPEMDGLELTKVTRSEFPDLHIICMTAHGAAYSYTDVVACGASDYITKPFTIDEMRAKLNRAIREKNLIRDITQTARPVEVYFHFERFARTANSSHCHQGIYLPHARRACGCRHRGSEGVSGHC